MRTDKKSYSKQGQYITGIDGLRAIAVLMVLAYHLQFPFAKGGLLGVTVFFVISGFLITRILVSELGSTRTIDLKKFWVRRIRRLLPAVLVMVSFLIFAGAVWNRVLFTKTCSDLLSAIFCYNNWHQIFRNVSYFENAGMPSPLTHCWSLSVEAQFYLVYPLLLIFLQNFRTGGNDPPAQRSFWPYFPWAPCGFCLIPPMTPAGYITEPTPGCFPCCSELFWHLPQGTALQKESRRERQPPVCSVMPRESPGFW